MTTFCVRRLSGSRLAAGEHHVAPWGLGGGGGAGAVASHCWDRWCCVSWWGCDLLRGIEPLRMLIGCWLVVLGARAGCWGCCRCAVLCWLVAAEGCGGLLVLWWCAVGCPWSPDATRGPLTLWPVKLPSACHCVWLCTDCVCAGGDALLSLLTALTPLKAGWMCRPTPCASWCDLMILLVAQRKAALPSMCPSFPTSSALCWP